MTDRDPDTERALLESMLEWNRDALVAAVAGLTDEQSRRRLVPSLTTPIGLVRHCTVVERFWFQRRLAHLPAAECDGNAVVDDGSWTVGEHESLDDVLAEYAAARARSVTIAAAFPLDAEAVGFRSGGATVRWLLVHMIEELARHAGHADILAEQIVAAEPPGSGS